MQSLIDSEVVDLAKVFNKQYHNFNKRSHFFKSFSAKATCYAYFNHFYCFQTNKITEIPARSLPDNLVQIDFSDNPITTIDDDAFDGSTSTLASLSFSGARFTRIPDAFRSLTALKELDIYSSLILDLNPDVMRNIGRTMQILDLRDVGLNAWPMWFKNFTSLVRFSIYDSPIYSIPEDAFYPLVDSL